MSGLASMQAALARLLREEASLVGRAGPEDVAARIAKGSDRLSPVEQLDVYREQFFLRHIDVLRDDFASIHHLLGCDAFDALARAYLAAHPPSSFSLRDLGHAMPRFVAETSPWSGDPLIAELARVEWAFVEAFDGPDAPPLDPATIAGAPEDAWPGARLVLHPSVQRLALEHPAHEYRQAVRKHEPATRPSPRRGFVVVYRGREALCFTDVEAEAFAMLDELARGATLSDACERAARATSVELSAFESKLAGWFSRWTALGWVSAVRFESS